MGSLMEDGMESFLSRCQRLVEVNVQKRCRCNLQAEERKEEISIPTLHMGHKMK